MVLNELNHVIEYIEDNLTDDLSLEKISVFAGVPDHHFRKIFFYLSGLTLSEYIKNKPAFNLVGVSKRVPMQFEGVNDEIVNLAESITDEQKKKCIPFKI